MKTFVLFFALLTAAGSSAWFYDNRPRGWLFRVCPQGHAVSQIRSVNSGNDRRWKIECNSELNELKDHRSCYWSGLVKLYEKELNYNCQPNGVVIGAYSSYSSRNGDRGWNILCCTTPKLVTYECRKSTMMNYFKENFQWPVPGNNFLTGIHTHQRSSTGDHRWSFTFCRTTTRDKASDSSQILVANSAIKDLAEGDVSVPKTANEKYCDNCRWPKPSVVVQVPYAISNSFSSSEKTTIRNAIDEFHTSTCIRFVTRVAQNDYVNIVKEEGCSSFVGKLGGSQKLQLGPGCVKNGIIQHELIHALGFWHEQSRSDRDDFIRIHHENIIEGREGNFLRRDTNNLNIPYDYSSVMHYGRTDFSKNGQNTITPLIASAAIGQRIGMSENDVLKVNKLYNCQSYLNKFGDWDNELGKNFQHKCPHGQAVSSIRSSYNAEHRDRQWAVSCKPFHVSSKCRWSGYVNRFFGHMDFKCADNEVIAGVYSRYNSILDDRKWKFFCCSKAGFTTVNCKKDTQVNYWFDNFHWRVATSNFLTGVKSSFDKRKRDRRWSFSYCQKNE